MRLPLSLLLGVCLLAGLAAASSATELLTGSSNFQVGLMVDRREHEQTLAGAVQFNLSPDLDLRFEGSRSIAAAALSLFGRSARTAPQAALVVALLDPGGRGDSAYGCRFGVEADAGEPFVLDLGLTYLATGGSALTAVAAGLGAWLAPDALLFGSWHWATSDATSREEHTVTVGLAYRWQMPAAR